MRIIVKRDLCCAAQLCRKVAPDMFRFDDLGYNDSDGDTVLPTMAALAKRAARACPERAISFDE
jgi:ferredoxin